MIAVTGANGQLGRLIINNLLKKTIPEDVIALVRNPTDAAELKALGIAVREADYEKPDTLSVALKGVTKLLLISSNAVGSRLPQHQAVINAAKNARVNLFAYTSILKSDTNPMGLAEEHKATEAAIKAAELPAVILRNGWYTENYTMGIANALESGFVAGAAGQGKLHTASREDYAEAAAFVLTSEEDQTGNVYELAGDNGFTLAEFAAEISRHTGKDIAYEDLNTESYRSLLVKSGLPDGFAALLADSEEKARDGWLAEQSTTLSRLIGRSTTPLSDSVRQAL